MKKTLKRLALSRETLVALDHFDFPVVGAARTVPPVCDFSNRNTCTTCQLTCTTNLC
ncbi:MAG: hypothetical protein WAM82_23790 [Thermoanaerobaculia bacterium]